MEWKLPLFRMYTDDADIEAVNATLRRGTFWAAGPEIERFEAALARYMGVEYALCVNSGTSALHVALLAHGVTGKEVIVPSFTFISTANAVLLAGGTPVFAEVERETFGLDAADVRNKITQKTAGIIPMHYGGFPCRDTLALEELVAEHGNLFLLEDAAESMGASIGEKKVGSIGASAILSFCQNKIITTGEGGAVLTNSREIFEKSKLLRSHGRLETATDYFSSTEDNDYLQVGYNYRMPSMLGALGLAQLEKIDQVIQLRRALARELDDCFSPIDEITVLQEPSDFRAVYQLYSILLSDQSVRDQLQVHLRDAGIMTKVYFNPAHLKTLYRDQHHWKPGDLPRTEDLSKVVLTLPFFPGMTREEISLLKTTITDFFQS